MLCYIVSFYTVLSADCYDYMVNKIEIAHFYYSKHRVFSLDLRNSINSMSTMTLSVILTSSHGIFIEIV